MNERLRKLDKAAQKYAGSIVGNDEDSNETEWFNVYKEKFAQLIVRECILNIRDNMEIAKVDTLGDKDLFLEILRTSGHFYITELEQHFGVEE